MNTEFQIISPIDRRQPVHPSITDHQVSDLVEKFYVRVRNNPDLSAIFATHMRNDWDSHLPKMKAFWRSVLLKTGEYKGKPVPVHTRLTGVGTEDFHIWLDLFATTVAEVITPAARPIVIEAATRIATSLWLARTADPFAPLPDWSTAPAHRRKDPAIYSERQTK